MKVYGIIGFPLGHSFSQKYFTAKFIREGIENCRYDVFPLQDIADFPALLKANPALCGLNVTIPHKQSVIPYLDDITNLPKDISACNCIKINRGKLSGFNTDIIGFEKSLTPLLKQYHNKALILGNGGAAEAVKFVLMKLGIAFKVVSRTLHNDSHLTYDNLNRQILDEHLLIINTTPLGTYPDVNYFPEIPYEYVSSRHYLFDLVYNPEKTIFLQKGAERGALIQNGYDMLLIQAEAGWDIWNS
ncbi:MAG: shikimate dehydrogenase [Ferruginibacter sp.]